MSRRSPRKIGPEGGFAVAPRKPRAAASPDSNSPSLLVSRVEWGRNAGLSYFDPSTGKYGRSMNDALGYTPTLTYAEYRARYERGGIAERIVEAYPRATWGGEISFQENPDPNDYTEFEQAADDLFDRLGAWNKLRRADVLAGLGDYSVVLIGAPGALDTPLVKVSKPEDVLYLSPGPQISAKIDSLDAVPTSPRYGLPLFYSVNTGTASNAEFTKVHYTRVLHVTEGELENDLYGKPRLRAVWNRLDDLDKILGGGAEAAWKRMDPGLQIDIDPEIELSVEEEDRLDAELDEYHHGARRHLRTRGGKISPLAANVAAFGSNATAIMEQISGTCGIPRRILIGSERGELSSLQDRDNWSDRVTERRREFAAPLILSLLRRFIEIGALPEPKGKVSVVWPEIEELNSAQKATVAGSLAAANQAQFNADGRIIIEPDEIRARVFGLAPLGQEPFSMIDPLEQAKLDAELDAADEELPTEEEDATADEVAAAALTICGGAAEYALAAGTVTSMDAVLNAADAHVPAIRRAFTRMWADAASLVSASAVQLELALSRQNSFGAESIVIGAINEAEVKHAENIRTQLDRVFFAGGAATLAAARARGSFFDTAPPALSTAAEGDDVQPVPPFTSVPAPSGIGVLGINMVFDAVNPRAVLYGRFRSSSLITQVNHETIEAVRILIARGISEGIKPRELRLLIERNIGLRTDQTRALENFVKRGATEAQTRRYAKKLLRDRATLIANTESARAANEGQNEAWLQAVDGNWLPPDQQRVWMVVNDQYLRDEHRAMAGQVRGLREKFVKPGGARINPGEEPNCMVPGTAVSGAFEAGLKAAYSGPVINIETRRGHRLTVTPNHPVLTPSGWVAAHLLSEGQNVVSGVDKHLVLSSVWDLDNQQTPARVEDVFNAFLSERDSICQVGCDDLHGDARFTDSHVEVVSAKRELCLPTDHVGNFQFVPADVEQSLVASSGTCELGLSAVLLPAPGDVGGSDLSLPLAAVHEGPFRPLRVGLASGLDVVKPEYAIDERPTHAEFVRELVGRSAGLVELDEIVNLSVGEFTGHVFDLQTATGWMLADGIVISNCRCSAALAYQSDVEKYKRKVKLDFPDNPELSL